MRKGFLTGSRRYGIPRIDSDIDLVILVDYDAYEKLVEHGADNNNYAPIRFGKLNVIACTEEKDFDLWQRVTEELAKKDGPVSREDAILAFTEARTNGQ